MTKQFHAEAVFSKHEEKFIIKDYKGTDGISSFLEGSDETRQADYGNSYSMVQWPRKEHLIHKHLYECNKIKQNIKKKS